MVAAKRALLLSTVLVSFFRRPSRSAFTFEALRSQPLLSLVSSGGYDVMIVSFPLPPFYTARGAFPMTILAESSGKAPFSNAQDFH
jgi:hypothetical protein